MSIFHTFLAERCIVPLWKTTWHCLIKWNIRTLSDPADLLPGIQSEGTFIHVIQAMNTKMFMTTHSKYEKNKKGQMPMDRRMDEVWYIYIKHNTEVKMNTFQLHPLRLTGHCWL